MTFQWPQIILLATLAIGFGVTLSRFGQPKRDKYDFTDLIIGPGILLGLLYWGGFFSHA